MRLLLTSWIPLLRELVKLAVIVAYLAFAVYLTVAHLDPAGFIPLLPWALGQTRPTSPDVPLASGHESSAPYVRTLCAVGIVLATLLCAPTAYATCAPAHWRDHGSSCANVRPLITRPRRRGDAAMRVQAALAEGVDHPPGRRPASRGGTASGAQPSGRQPARRELAARAEQRFAARRSSRTAPPSGPSTRVIVLWSTGTGSPAACSALNELPARWVRVWLPSVTADTATAPTRFEHGRARGECWPSQARR